jgi:DNA (cytosine-5)-methyltransferase 1
VPAYYNEIDPFAAQWLRNLIAAGHIAPGEVDERSIVEVDHRDLRGFDQCHFFAGIGVWSHALRGAGWSDDRPVWTGSCPCQPFSAAGAGKEFADERHLWPAWFELIRLCRPVAVFGEQVASKDALAWLDHVCADLEGEDYAVGAVDTCAAGFGAPHIRQRLYWVADAECGATERHGQELGSAERGMQGQAHERKWLRDDVGHGELAGIVGNAIDARPQGQQRSGDMGLHGGEGAHGSTPTAGFWRDAEWLPCRDGKARPVEPGSPPLVAGASQRVGRLRSYGNSIVTPQATEFVRAFLEVQP